MRIDMNKVAREITLKEGGKVNTNIAQVKEVLKLFLESLGKMKQEDIERLIQRYRK